MAETVQLKSATIALTSTPNTVFGGKVIYIHSTAATPSLITHNTNAATNTLIGSITLSSGNGAACQVTLIKRSDEQLFSNSASGVSACVIGYTE